MISVVGTGALGLLVAALAREAGEDVLVLARDEERARKLDAVLVDGRRVPLRATADPSVLPRAGLVVVAVKAKDDAAVAASLAGLPKCATVLTLGNGLGRGEALAATLGDDRVLVGVTAQGATLEGEGRVRHAGRGPTKIAPLVAAALPRARKAVRTLGFLGDVTLEESAATIVWQKVAINAAINATAALLDAPNGALLEAPSARAIAQRAAEEAGRVAHALGVPGAWSPEDVRSRWEAVARATAGNLCSTVQDQRARRMSEIHAINGAIARSASQAGIETPANELLAALIAAREELFPRKESPPRT